MESYDPDEFPRPSGREEEWRFTPLDRITALLDAAPADGSLDVSADVSLEHVDPADERVGSALTPTDRVAATALARSEKPRLLAVPRAPGEFTAALRLRGDGGVVYDHLVVDVPELTQATVVLDHTGSATYAGNVELLVGDGARLTLVSVQDWDDDAVHLGHHAARLGRDATLRSVVVSFGGGLVRLNPRVAFVGPGAGADLFGLFYADAGQHLEHRLFVDHAAPHCRSRVLYKGAVQGREAHSVWVGDVLIRPDAVGTDTFELNRNLVLTDDARADSVPNLEILTGEVTQAGHASATGRFDDEQLFYLQARGIPAEEARRLVVRGFFAEVLGQVTDPELQDRLGTVVEHKLAKAGR